VQALDYPGLAGAELSPADTSLLAALKETVQRYLSPEERPDSGLETPVFTEPMKEYLSRWGERHNVLAALAPGAAAATSILGAAVPGTRGEALVAASNAALPIASAMRGPQVVQAGATAADDLIAAYRWGDPEGALRPGNWVEAGSASKPFSYLLSTKWVPSVGGSKFAGYGSGVEHVVRRGDLQPATGLGAGLASFLGQRRFVPTGR
jgi:hypothetical protein